MKVCHVSLLIKSGIFLRWAAFFIRSFVVASFVMTSATAQAPLDVRIALIIGNSAYPGSPLRNPANDAREMSQILRQLGF